MKRHYLIVLTVAVFIIAVGISTVLAGGSSDTSGDGYHCYLFFTLPDGTFAQFMANSSDPDEVVKKAQDSVDKYETDEGGELKFLILGNADEACVAIPGEGVIDEDAVCDSLVPQKLGKETGFKLKYVYELFPSGPAK